MHVEAVDRAGCRPEAITWTSTVLPPPEEKMTMPVTPLVADGVSVATAALVRLNRDSVTFTSGDADAGVTGIVVFAGGGNSVDVHVIASGLQPGSIHAFHVHENGTCASADFMTAGGHFNPTHKPHGPQDKPHHAGDMPSLLADPAGKIDARFTLEGVTLGGAEGFVGHAVILHATADDFDAQPSGNSGARIACGVIAAE